MCRERRAKGYREFGGDTGVDFYKYSAPYYAAQCWSMGMLIVGRDRRDLVQKKKN